MRNIALQGYRSSSIHPHTFALWISMGSILMMFMALTSAYIVRQAAGNWLDFRIPSAFYASTAVILLASVSLHLAKRAFRRKQKTAFRSFLVGAFLLGTTFISLQYTGWQALYDGQGVDLKGNPSGAFFYVITGVHAVHVLGGIMALMVSLMLAFTRPFKATRRRLVRFNLVVQYWHFVDLLWVYLLIFLLITR